MHLEKRGEEDSEDHKKDGGATKHNHGSYSVVNTLNFLIGTQKIFYGQKNC